jgi:hypothetical protein
VTKAGAAAAAGGSHYGPDLAEAAAAIVAELQATRAVNQALQGMGP